VVVAGTPSIINIPGFTTSSCINFTPLGDAPVTNDATYHRFNGGCTVISAQSITFSWDTTP
jgi:hypothetical protein